MEEATMEEGGWGRGDGGGEMEEGEGGGCEVEDARWRRRNTRGAC